MILEIKTTREIERELNKLILNAKDLNSIQIRDYYTEKRWIDMEDLWGWLDDIKQFQSPAIIHVDTLIDLIKSHSKNSRSSDEDSLNKGYEIPSKQVALHPNLSKAQTSHNPYIK